MPRTTPRTAPTTHRDVMKIRATVSEIHRDVARIFKNREDNDCHNQEVSDFSSPVLLSEQ
jgi:hypothetical protein